MTARVYDLAAARARRRAHTPEQPPRRAWLDRTLGDTLFGIGLAIGAWRSQWRRHR